MSFDRNEYMRKYRKLNSEKMRAYENARYEERKEDLKEKAKFRYEKHKDKQKEYREKNKEKRRLTTKLWQEKNKEAAKLYRKDYAEKNKAKIVRSAKNNRLKREYGITLEDYEQMYQTQQGKCSICSKEEKILNIDHCHSTGKIRELLCNQCNHGIGNFKDNTELLNKAIGYLEKHGK